MRIFKLLTLGAGLAFLTACSSSVPGGTYYRADASTAAAILGPVERYNPNPGQPRQHGNTAYGEVSINNGVVVHDSQHYTGWSKSGNTMPSDVRRSAYRQPYYQYRRPYYQPPRRMRYCYDSYRNRQYRC